MYMPQPSKIQERSPWHSELVRGGFGDVFPGSAATHAASRLGEGGLELFGAGAVDLGDRYYGVGEVFSTVSALDRDDASRTPGGSAAPSFSPSPLSTLCLAKFADDGSGRAAEDDHCQERTRERAHDQADAGADLESFASEVVAGLIHG